MRRHETIAEKVGDRLRFASNDARGSCRLLRGIRWGTARSGESDGATIGGVAMRTARHAAAVGTSRPHGAAHPRSGTPVAPLPRHSPSAPTASRARERCRHMKTMRET